MCSLTSYKKANMKTINEILTEYYVDTAMQSTMATSSSDAELQEGDLLDFDQIEAELVAIIKDPAEDPAESDMQSITPVSTSVISSKTSTSDTDNNVDLENTPVVQNKNEVRFGVPENYDIRVEQLQIVRNELITGKREKTNLNTNEYLCLALQFVILVKNGRETIHDPEAWLIAANLIMTKSREQIIEALNTIYDRLHTEMKKENFRDVLPQMSYSFKKSREGVISEAIEYFYLVVSEHGNEMHWGVPKSYDSRMRQLDIFRKKISDRYHHAEIRCDIADACLALQFVILIKNGYQTIIDSGWPIVISVIMSKNQGTIKNALNIIYNQLKTNEERENFMKVLPKVAYSFKKNVPGLGYAIENFQPLKNNILCNQWQGEGGRDDGNVMTTRWDKKATYSPFRQ